MAAVHTPPATPRNSAMLGTMPNGKIPFDPRNSDLDTVRQIVIERLQRDTTWTQLDYSGDGFTPFVEYVGQNEPERQNGRHRLLFLAQEVFWQLVVGGVLAPGMDSSSLKLPFFHITKYGRGSACYQRATAIRPEWLSRAGPRADCQPGPNRDGVPRRIAGELFERATASHQL